MKNDYKERAKVFKAFCDENRLQILDLLRFGERCACSLLEELHISQPTLSHHMKILCDAGVVAVRREGKWSHYSINPSGIERVRALLEQCPLCGGSSRGGEERGAGEDGRCLAEKDPFCL